MNVSAKGKSAAHFWLLPFAVWKCLNAWQFGNVICYRTTAHSCSTWRTCVDYDLLQSIYIYPVLASFITHRHPSLLTVLFSLLQYCWTHHTIPKNAFCTLLIYRAVLVEVCRFLSCIICTWYHILRTTHDTCFAFFGIYSCIWLF